MKRPFGALPISDAPKDGTYVLLIGNLLTEQQTRHAVVAKWVEGISRWKNPWGEDIIGFNWFMPPPWEVSSLSADNFKGIEQALLLALAADGLHLTELTPALTRVVEIITKHLNSCAIDAYQFIKENKSAPTVDSVLSQMQSLSDDARLNIMESFCVKCGKPDSIGNPSPCFCE